jgi:hypothetical protein
MTAVHPPTTAHRPSPRLGALRQLLLADALATGGAGLALLLAADPLAEEAGLTTSGPLLLVGGFFAVLAVVVAAVRRAGHHTLLRLVRVNGTGDLVWAAASVVVGLGSDLSGAARAVVLLQAAAVLGVGEAKLVLARRARSSAKISG